MHITLDQLPSHYVPYSDEVRKEKIKIRPLTYGEVLTFSEYKDNFIDLLSFMGESDIVRGIAFEDITIGDWEFIELSLVAMSYADPIYTVSFGECEACKEKMSDLPEEELYLKVGKQVISKIPMLAKKIKQGEINFKEIIEDVTSEGEVTLENGTNAIVDFYRLKHYKTLLQEKKEDSEERKIELLSNLIINDISLLDYTILTEVVNLMEHGLDSTFTIHCPNASCNVTKTFSFEWRLLQLRSFSFDNELIRRRISFGKTRKLDTTTKQELQGSKSTIRPSR